MPAIPVLFLPRLVKRHKALLQFEGAWITQIQPKEFVIGTQHRNIPGHFYPKIIFNFIG